MHTQHQHTSLKRYVILRVFYLFKKQIWYTAATQFLSSRCVLAQLCQTTKAKENYTDSTDDKILQQNLVQVERILRNQKQL